MLIDNRLADGTVNTSLVLNFLGYFNSVNIINDTQDFHLL